MEFHSIGYFFLLLLLIPYIVWYVFFNKKNQPTMRMSDTRAYEGMKRGWKTNLVHLPMILRCIAFVLIVIVMARPQTHTQWGKKTVEGIDVMLAMDVSTSMLALDLEPNRMEAAKMVAKEFIAGRENDNIGLTIFAGEAFTQCPMTLEHATLLNLLTNVRTDIAATGIISDGTAIGMGLANAVSRLKDSHAKSKVIILLTDGSNNCGDISPMTAAEIAKKLDVRVYTIGVGTTGVAMHPVNVGGTVQYLRQKVEIDETMLSEIASMTGGNYYRATNTDELRRIYGDIDKLEKTKLEEKTFSQRFDVFMPFALAALLVLVLEVLVRMVVLKRIP